MLSCRVLAVGFVVAACMASFAAAAPTAEQRGEVQAIGVLLTKAGNLYKEQKFKESGEAIKEVQTRLAKLADGADQQMIGQLQPLHKRLVNAHALLELEGIVLPELKPLEKPTPTKTPGKKGATANSPGTVSFVKDVVPVLNARCGNCHVRAARGMFSMATYEVLMSGPPKAGKVILPGKSAESLLIAKIQDKEMPPSGAGIPDAELSTLKKWVDEGAKFDGKDQGAQLTSLIPAGTQAAANPAAMVQQATGKETVSFAREIAPVLAAKCTGCHGMQNPRNNFNISTIGSLMRGGDRGEPVLPGKPADSLLLKKLKGTADGARMPMRGGPLDDAFIAKVEKWIQEGAKFDGDNPGQQLARVAEVSIAQHSTHDELSAKRVERAAENWRLGMPSTQPNKAESANFLVLGNVGENTLADIAKRAEAVAPKVADVFKSPRGQPLIKGRMTLFVFGERYDYAEFGKMVEKRDIPLEWRGHFGYDVVDAYGAVLTPKTNDLAREPVVAQQLDALIGQQLGAVYVASQGKGVPRWLAEGCGRVVATRLAPASDPRIARWDDELSGTIGSLAAPDDFLKSKLSPEQNDVCSFSFAKFLMNDAKRFGALLEGLRKGTPFAKAFSDAYGDKPEALAAVWVRNPPKAGRRGK